MADMLAVWAQLILTLFMASNILMIVVPAAALLANYFINYKYYRIWNELDPPKPNKEE
jgi:hypothetical protein